MKNCFSSLLKIIRSRMKKSYRILFSWCNSFLATCFMLVIFPAAGIAQNILLEDVTIVTGSTVLSNGEKAAARVLIEEVEKRTGLKWKSSAVWPAAGNGIVLKKTTDK